LKKLSFGLRFLLGRAFATDYMACGIAAAETAFGKRLTRAGTVTILPNGIDVERYRFDDATRQATRQALGLSSEAIAVGMVARFSPQKNHEAALRIFEAYRRRHPEAVLLLAGDGELRPQIEALAAEKLPAEAVRFLGVREDIPALLSAMDRFLLSSRFEGFPITLVEAQSAGLPCAVADTVSREVALTDLVAFSDTADTERFCEILEQTPASPRERYAKNVSSAGFSLADAAERLYRFYQSKKT
jgi:glycosyltransferase involved in cell wall biosynthesis